MRASTSLKVLCAVCAAVTVGASAIALAPPAAQAAPIEVSGAVLQWGMNAETGSAGFAPGTCNFFGAGAAGDSGGGQWPNSPARDEAGEYVVSAKTGQELWRGQQGSVSILKPAANGAYAPITWADKCTTRTGQRTDTNGAVSEAVVRIEGGTGSLDPATGSATISWKGSWTVAFYSGMTYWSANDPVLTVENGVGTLTATASGFGASMSDPDAKPTPLTPRKVTLATLKDVTVTDKGLTVVPEYRGVEVASPANAAPQARTGADWGSWPQDFVDFQGETGQHSYWYSSGSSADDRKPPSPLAVAVPGNGGDAPAPDPAPQPTPTTPTPTPTAPDPAPTTPAPEPTTPGPAPSGKGGGSLSDANLRWSMSDEANSGAYNGDCNFLSAGVAASTGSSRPWDSSFYSASSGNVSIVKADGAGGWTGATWQNHCLDAAGNKVSSNDLHANTGSQVVVTGGKGTVAADGATHIEWKGSWTVAFYGGMNYWSITDPVLDVDASGSGTLTATASGYGADRNDTSVWLPLPTQKVTLATLTGVDVGAAASASGFTHTPDYLGVSVRVGSSVTKQAARTSDNAEYWGSFPQDFVTYQEKTGQSSYWYTSGGTRDAAKKAAPLTVAYTASFTTPSSTNDGIAGARGRGTTSARGSTSRASSGSGTAAQNNSTAAGRRSASAGPSAPPVPVALGPDAGFAEAGGYTVNRVPAARGLRDSAGRIALGAGVMTAGSGLPLLLGWLIRRQLGLDPRAAVLR